MARWIRTGRLCALPLYGFAALAIAQPAPQLEVDFTSATVPLSPTLSMLIAVVIAALGIYSLRRMRGRARIASWVVVALAAIPLASALTHTRLIGDAQAISITSFPLTANPATLAISGGGYFQAANATGTNITLIAIKLNNPGLLIIYAPDTTCVPGLSMSSGESCRIHVATTT